MELKVHLWAGWSCEDLVHSSQLPRYGNGDPERGQFSFQCSRLSHCSTIERKFCSTPVLGEGSMICSLLSCHRPFPSHLVSVALTSEQHRTRPPGLNEAWLPDRSIPGLHGKGILEKLMGEFCMRISPQIYLRCLVYVVLPFRAEVAPSLLLGR